MDLLQVHADLGPYIPAESRAYHARAEMIVACFRVAQRDGKVLGDVVE